MAYSSSTANYHLPLPTDNDKSTWTDNNEAFSAIDAAIKANADALAALTARVQALEDSSTVDLTGFVKVDTENGTGLTNAQYKKLVVEE